MVPVEEEYFRKECWRPIACIKAAVILELPFTQLLNSAKFGLRAEDKQRLIAACSTTQEDKHG